MGIIPKLNSRPKPRCFVNDLVKWLLRTVAAAVIWVFVLSIHWGGRPLFVYANETLVQNPLVQAADEELADLWQRLGKAARLTFAKATPDESKSM